jgi:hypothetical protein
MSEPIDKDFKLLLARAFGQGWAQYYGPDKMGPLSEETARTELARCLVEMAKNGLKEENALTMAGVLHLVTLTMDKPEK